MICCLRLVFEMRARSAYRTRVFERREEASRSQTAQIPWPRRSRTSRWRSDIAGARVIPGRSMIEALRGIVVPKYPLIEKVQLTPRQLPLIGSLLPQTSPPPMSVMWIGRGGLKGCFMELQPAIPRALLDGINGRCRAGISINRNSALGT